MSCKCLGGLFVEFTRGAAKYKWNSMYLCLAELCKHMREGTIQTTHITTWWLSYYQIRMYLQNCQIPTLFQVHILWVAIIYILMCWESLKITFWGQVTQVSKFFFLGPIAGLTNQLLVWDFWPGAPLIKRGKNKIKIPRYKRKKRYYRTQKRNRYKKNKK